MYQIRTTLLLITALFQRSGAATQQDDDCTKSKTIAAYPVTSSVPGYRIASSGLPSSVIHSVASSSLFSTASYSDPSSTLQNSPITVISSTTPSSVSSSGASSDGSIPMSSSQILPPAPSTTMFTSSFFSPMAPTTLATVVISGSSSLRSSSTSYQSSISMSASHPSSGSPSALVSSSAARSSSVPRSSSASSSASSSVSRWSSTSRSSSATQASTAIASSSGLSSFVSSSSVATRASSATQSSSPLPSPTPNSCLQSLYSGYTVKCNTLPIGSALNTPSIMTTDQCVASCTSNSRCVGAVVFSDGRCQLAASVSGYSTIVGFTSIMKITGSSSSSLMLSSAMSSSLAMSSSSAMSSSAMSSSSPSPSPSRTPSSSSSTPAPVVTDVILNGGFEDSLNGNWIPRARAGYAAVPASSANNVHSGNKAMVFDATIPGTTYISSTNQVINVKPGTKYTFRFWSRQADSNACNMAVSLGNTNFPSFFPSTAWGTQMYDWTADSSSANLVFLVSCASGRAVYLDDVSLSTTATPVVAPASSASITPTPSTITLPSVPMNQIANPDFESPLDGTHYNWTPRGGANGKLPTISTERPYSGKYSMKFEASAAGPYSASVSIPFSCDPGETYTLSLRSSQLGSGSSGCTITPFIDGSSRTNFAPIVPTSDWASRTYSWYSDGAEGTLSFALICGTATPVYLDYVSLSN